MLPNPLKLKAELLLQYMLLIMAIFQVSEVLRRRTIYLNQPTISEHLARRDSRPTNYKLTLTEKITVVDRILSMDLRGLPPRSNTIQQLANLLKKNLVKVKRILLQLANYRSTISYDGIKI